MPASKSTAQLHRRMGLLSILGGDKLVSYSDGGASSEGIDAKRRRGRAAKKARRLNRRKK